MLGTYSRRRLLGSIGATGATAGLAGCAGVFGGGGGTQVAGLIVQSNISERCSVRVEIDRNGERVFEESFDIADVHDVETREVTWPTNERATFTVHTVVSGPEMDETSHTWGPLDGPPREDTRRHCWAFSVTADNGPLGVNPLLRLRIEGTGLSC